MSDYEFIDITNYSETSYSQYTPVIQRSDPHLAIQEHYEYDGTPKSNIPQYITYMDHPTVVNVKETVVEEEEQEKDQLDLNTISQFYFGSLTIIGLFIVFRILQLKK
jgi:hypothetical protein